MVVGNMSTPLKKLVAISVITTMLLVLKAPAIFAQGESQLVHYTSTPTAETISNLAQSIACALYNNMPLVAVLVILGSFITYAIRSFIDYIVGGGSMGGFMHQVRSGLISSIIAGLLTALTPGIVAMLFSIFGISVDFSVCKP